MPESALVDLRRRIAATRWPDRETVVDQPQGMQLARIQALADYWRTGYDWRKAEARLNALPLLITPGWPGLVLELLNVIGPLTDPIAYGRRADDAFDLVIPSMPGRGFSAKPKAPRWGPDRVARAWATLMDRLGYKSYVPEGVDWGPVVATMMARQAAPGLLGIHVNLPATAPPHIAKAMMLTRPQALG